MFKRSKSIKELYGETKHFGLVITNDPALATGLNRMVDEPRLGTFALTPRQIALRYGALATDKVYTTSQVVADLSQKMKLPVRVIHPMLERIIEVWKFMGLLESCELYLNKDETMLARKLRGYATIELLMEEFNEEFYGHKSIAVIGRHLFTLLDLQVLPKRRPTNEIDLFTGEFSFPIDRTYLFPSANDMVNSVVDCITKENENDVSIVMNFNSSYLTALKSRLKQKGINIIENSFLSQEGSTRDFMKLAAMSFTADELLVSDVRLVSESLGVVISSVFDNWSFKAYAEFRKDDVALARLYSVIQSLGGKKYSEAVKLIQDDLGLKFSDQFFALLDLLGLNNKMITEDNFSDINYFIRFIDADTGKTNEGVLFANSLNSVYINRDIVFYLGFDASWTKRIGDLECIDRNEEEKRNLDKFQILLSQGEQKYYFTYSVSGGEETIPCHYFNILIDRKLNGFSAQVFNSVLPSLKVEKLTEFAANPEVKKSEISFTQFSQSSLSRYYSCPKRFAYSRLISLPENPAMHRGKLIHSFAEFCFDYPEFTEENFEKILDVLLREFGRFRSDMDDMTDRTIFAIAMRQILGFVKEVDVERIVEKGREVTKNILYREFRKKKLYGNTELQFSEVPPGIRGVIDLTGGRSIYDYKSSARKSPSQYVNKSVVSLLEGRKSHDADFQTTMYLLYLLGSGHDNLPALFCYLFPADKTAEVINGLDPQMSRSVIRYMPATLNDYLTGDEFYDKAAAKSRAVSRLSRERWNKFVSGYAEALDIGKDIRKEATGEFFDIVTKELGLVHSDFKRKSESTFYENEIESVGKLFSNLRCPYRGDGIIFRNDAARLEEYIKAVITEANYFANTKFPGRPAYDKRKVCNDCDYLSICTENKLWEGSGGTESDNNDNHEQQ